MAEIGSCVLVVVEVEVVVVVGGVVLRAFFRLSLPPVLCKGFLVKSGGHCSTRCANGFGGCGRLYVSLYRSFH